MASRSEVLGNGPIGGEESLGVSRGLKPLQAPLPLASWLVGMLRTVIEVPVLAVRHPRKHLPLRCPMAFQFVCNDDPRHIGQALQELTEKLLRRLLVPLALHEDVEHMPLLIDSPPQIMAFLADREKYLVQMPLIPRSGVPPTELIRIRLPTLPKPRHDFRDTYGELSRPYRIGVTIQILKFQYKRKP